jgi:hypothetical protein
VRGKRAHSSAVPRIVLALVLLQGCGAKARDARPLPTLVTQAPSAEPVLPKPVEPPPAFEALAAKQLRLAPGMRELARGDASGAAPLPKLTRDTCVRVAYASTTPVTAALVAHDGAVLAASTAMKEGALGERGPVCFHPESEPRLEVGGDAGVVRYVVWAAP